MSGAVMRVAAAPAVLFLVEVVNCNDGIATYIQTLAVGLKARGVRVYLVSGPVKSDATSAGKRTALADAVEEWVMLPPFGRVPRMAFIRRIVGLVRRHGVGAVNTHGLGMLAIGKVVAAMTGVRFVGTYHQSVTGGLEQVKRSANQPFGLGQQMFLTLFAPERLIVLSDESVAFMRGHRLPFRQRVTKVVAGTELAHFRPPSPAERAAARAWFGLGDDEFVCLLAARLAWVKGHDVLIRAARRLAETDPGLRTTCLFVGSGGADREAEIKDFAVREGGGGRFRFAGFMSDVRPALWAADAFVLPSRFEGFAIGVVEAMATGLVPVRTPSGGATDQIVDGHTGFIVPHEQPDALADALRRLADPRLRREMGARNVVRAHELFGIPSMVDAMLDLYGLEPAAHP